jgi:hypothetical protein
VTPVVPSRLVLACVLAAAAVVALTACAERDMSGDDAREFTRRALEEVGLEDVRVARRAEADTFRPTSGDPIEVWETQAAVAGGTVHLYIDRGSDRAVFLNDVAGGGGALLTDDQFAELERFRLNPAAERHRDRLRVPAGVAIGLAALAGAALCTALLTRRVPLRGLRPRARGLL